MEYTVVTFEGTTYYFYGDDCKQQARDFLSQVR